MTIRLALALSVGLLVGASSVASAQAPAVNWSGFYVGGNAGYAWGQTGITPVLSDLSCLNGTAACQLGYNDASIAALRSLPNASFSQTGGFAGGQVGYNFQSGQTVLGVEADLAWTKLQSSYSASGTARLQVPILSAHVGYSAKDSLDYFGTVRGRIGFLVSPPLLVFATGGLAYGKLTSEASFSGSITGPGIAANGILNPAATATTTQIGFTVGGGAEYKISNNWSVKAEYLYFELPGYSTAIGDHAIINGANQVFSRATVNQNHSDYRASILRFGINYQFN